MHSKTVLNKSEKNVYNSIGAKLLSFGGKVSGKETHKFESNVYKHYSERSDKEFKKNPINRNEFNELMDYVRRYLVLAKKISNEPFIDIHIDDAFILHAAVVGKDVVMDIFTTIEYRHLIGGNDETKGNN